MSWLGHKDGALIKEITVLVPEAQVSSPGLFYHVTHRDMFYLKNLSILKKVPE